MIKLLVAWKKNLECITSPILALSLFINVAFFYVFLYLNVLENVSFDCVRFFQRPHESHLIRVRRLKPSFDATNLPQNDFQQLIDLHNFSILIQDRHPCGDDVFLLILVPSSPKNLENRQTIRTTWGAKRKGIKLLFVMGVPEDSKAQETVAREFDSYEDIIQGNFMDTYRNLTYKTVMSLKYLVYNCPKALYVLKADDDTFVNINLMMNFLQNDISPFGAENLFLCKDMIMSPVVRDNQSKWYVSKEEYAEQYYPSYCLGGVPVLLSPDVCYKLYEQAQSLKYVPIEDAFVYGIAASQVPNLSHRDISRYTMMYRKTKDLLEDKLGEIPLLYGTINMSPELIRSYWHYFNNRKVQDSVLGTL